MNLINTSSNLTSIDSTDVHATSHQSPHKFPSPPPSSLASPASNTSLPPDASARQHVVDAFRLRRYEINMLRELSCFACGVPPGSLSVWRDGIGAKCSRCNSVMEGPKLRDSFESFMACRTDFAGDVHSGINNCKREVSILGDKIENLKSIIAKHSSSTDWQSRLQQSQ